MYNPIDQTWNVHGHVLKKAASSRNNKSVILSLEEEYESNIDRYLVELNGEILMVARKRKS